MSFTQNELNKLAHLARLTLNQGPTNENSFDHSIAKDLSNILQLVSAISEINTNNIVPMEHSIEAKQRCRADIVSEPDVREKIQQIAPDNATAAGLYLVPRVIE
jgi:aspartyl-tRNA(Asn)/glutamyl-tRNA(Gln) amidotransferase subunit C